MTPQADYAALIAELRATTPKDSGYALSAAAGADAIELLLSQREGLASALAKQTASAQGAYRAYEAAESEVAKLRADAERWRAMRECYCGWDWEYGDKKISVALFKLKAGLVGAGPKGADDLADAARNP